MDKSLMKEKYMVTKNPGAVLFVFALPMIIGNLFQQFYNMVDTIIVGRFIGTQALAAVGASYAFTNVFIMIAIGGGIGASVLTSQYLGAEEYGKMRTSVFTALISFLLISVCLALLGFVLNPLLMRLLRTPQDVFSDAVLYLQIYFAGIPFLFMYNVITATFNALGKSYIPLVFLYYSGYLDGGAVQAGGCRGSHCHGDCSGAFSGAVLPCSFADSAGIFGFGRRKGKAF